MRLLITTQTLDSNDPILGFFHRWVEEFAKKFEFITVICLQKGACHLPDNVEVFSLGKERGTSRFVRIVRFLRVIVTRRFRYDAVFVHMNQEYILLGGIVWKILGTRIYLWRNHGAGSFLTDVAAAFCTKVFCTSTFSYTARYKKTTLMPVGVDTASFKPDASTEKIPRSILFLGRIAPSKHPDIFIEALGILHNKGVAFLADVYGDALPKDREYYDNLLKRVEELELAARVTFHPGIPNYATAEVYNRHEWYVNLSDKGMLDKTIFEALACDVPALCTNADIEAHLDPDLFLQFRTPSALAERLEMLLALPKEKKSMLAQSGRAYVLKYGSLSALTEKLCMELNSKPSLN